MIASNKRNIRNLVTVVIPAYNHQNYVQDTINSIISQTYRNIELIIINDGSSDSTEQRILEMEKDCKDRFVKYKFISNSNQGVAGTLNEGLKHATGEFFYLIASDDMAHPQAIQVLVNTLNTNSKYGLAVGDNSIMDADSKLCYWDRNRNNVYTKQEATFISFGHYLQEKRQDINFSSYDFGCYGSLLKANYVPNGYLIRKRLLDGFGGFKKEAPLEDHYLMMQLSKITKLKYIDEPLFSYRWHAANSIKNSERMAELGSKTLQFEESYARSHGYGKLWEVVCCKSRVVLVDYKILKLRLLRRKIEIKLLGFIKFNIKNDFYVSYLDRRHEKLMNLGNK